MLCTERAPRILMHESLIEKITIADLFFPVIYLLTLVHVFVQSIKMKEPAFWTTLMVAVCFWPVGYLLWILFWPGSVRRWMFSGVKTSG